MTTDGAITWNDLLFFLLIVVLISAAFWFWRR